MIRRPPRSTRTDNSFPTRRYSDLDIVHPVARKDQRVDVLAAGYHVFARAREDRVVARAAMHVIVAAAAIQQVVAGAAIEFVAARAAIKLVIARIAVQRVVAVGVGIVAMENVIARPDRKSTRLNSSH